MRTVRLVLSLVFCAFVVVYINSPTGAQALKDGMFQARHSSDTSLGPLEQVMAATLGVYQSMIGLGPQDTEAPANRMPQIGGGGPNIQKAATMTDPMAAAAEMAGVEERILNSPMGKMIGGMAAKQERVQSGPRFIKIPD